MPKPIGESESMNQFSKWIQDKDLWVGQVKYDCESLSLSG